MRGLAALRVRAAHWPDVSASATIDRRSRQDGFALVVVIWAVGLLSLLFMTYVGTARYRALEAASLGHHARAEAAAQAGVKLAILDLVSARRQGAVNDGRFRIDGTARACILDDAVLKLTVSDEGGKVDLNSATPELVAALIRGVGRDRLDADAIIRRITTLREAAADNPSLAGAISASRQAFRSTTELGQIDGVGRELFTALRPLVTVHSGGTGIDPQTAPVSLLMALLPDRATSRELAQRELPALYTIKSPAVSFLIVSEAKVASGARFRQEAIVDITPELPAGYRIREWRDGNPHSAETIMTAAPC